MLRSSLPSILQQIVTPCAAWTGTLGAERRTVILMALQAGLCWPLQEAPWALHIFTGSDLAASCAALGMLRKGQALTREVAVKMCSTILGCTSSPARGAWCPPSSRRIPPLLMEPGPPRCARGGQHRSLAHYCYFC